MPAPRWLARVNRRLTNRLLPPVVGRLPGFAVVVHSGRRTRRTYRTPVLSFHQGERCIIALTYGPQSDWVRNVLAAGGCRLELRRKLLVLTSPRLYHDPAAVAAPPPIRTMLRLLRVSDFLELQRER
ncbi:MAG: nitroreductase family deazaflavin-dependent oxidoreductase [Chloroflexota bacterium]|nr:nitroreductase family deazaflavin-dependent oxidoreductase [Chloroflexota bacterium]